MSRIRNMISLVLAAAMLLGMTAVAMAAEINNSITVENTRDGEKYQLYKLFDLVVDNEEKPGAYKYIVNADWEAFFKADGAQYITAVTENNKLRVDSIVGGEEGAAALAKAAANWNGKPAPVKTLTCEVEEEKTGSVVFDNLEHGYYLITSTLGTVAMTRTTPDENKVTVEEKNPVDTITKQVKEDSKPEADAWGSENDAQVGDTVEFKSVATILKNTRNVKIYDKMEAGLTYNEESIQIEGLTKDKDYTVVENTDGYAFVITFAESYLEGLKAETDLTLTYTAILNEKAIVITESEGNKSAAIDDQNNKIKITFGDAQFVEASTTTTTHKFSVYKHAEGKTEYLAGATFSLKKGNAENSTVVKLIRIDDNNYRVANGEEGAVETFTTNDKGDIVIWGVDSDTDYTLKETAAPSGYNMLTDEVAVTVNADNATRADITNSTGVKLPTTGGMGTKMFYIVGMMLMTGSAVMLITKKRMKAE
ncbi:MAG: LPXTG cell wall anchor domain-containing protein [Clostridia bacterium]|nr:LPXTG cell wall anchor domain-containing protein [Clostridia bacterium]